MLVIPLTTSLNAFFDKSKCVSHLNTFKTIKLPLIIMNQKAIFSIKSVQFFLFSQSTLDNKNFSHNSVTHEKHFRIIKSSKWKEKKNPNNDIETKRLNVQQFQTKGKMFVRVWIQLILKSIITSDTDCGMSVQIQNKRTFFPKQKKLFMNEVDIVCICAQNSIAHPFNWMLTADSHSWWW